jgi:hypothetical protein
MQNGSWGQAIAEIVQAAAAGFVHFWKQTMV